MIARYFLLQMEKEGYKAELSGDKLFFPPLEMELSFEHVYTQDFAMCIKVAVTHPFLLPDGLHELAFGFGEDDETRYAFAAKGWMDTDFPVIHSYLCPTQTDLKVKRMELVSQTGDIQLGWNALLGPIFVIGDQMNLSEDSTHELFLTLFNDVTGAMRSPHVIYLKCFVSKAGDGSINADCRLQGQDWIEGTDTLYHFADKLDTKGNFHSRKQFIIIYPRPLEELKKGEAFAKDVKEKYTEMYGQPVKSVEKRWFEFWK